MPVGAQYDFALDGKGYMLVRDLPQGSPPAWHRTGIPDSTSQRSSIDAKYGNLPDQVDHPSVWDDWSGGCGYPIRGPEAPNTYDWAENAETRWPNQLTHAVELQTIPSTYGSYHSGAQGFLSVPLPSVNTPVGGGGVLVIERGADGDVLALFSPTGLNTVASAFDVRLEVSVNSVQSTPFMHGQAAIFGSFAVIGNKSGSGFVRRGFNAEYTTATIPGRFFLNSGTKLWRHHGINMLQNVAAGADVMTVGNYSATFNVGNGFLQEDSSIAVFDQVFVGLADGLHAGDTSGTFSNVLAELRDQRHPDNCRDLAGYQGGIATPVGNSLWWFRPWQPVVAQDISPPANTSQVRGRYMAVKGFGPWLYTGVFTGSQSHLLAGQATGEPGAPYIWHHLHRLPNATRVNRIFFDGITTPSGGGLTTGSQNTTEFPSKMWLACDASFVATAAYGLQPLQVTATAPIYFAQIPKAFGNTLLDPTYTGSYMGSIRIDLGADDWEAPSTSKAYRLLEVWADSLLSGNRFAEVYYNVDRGARTYLGRAQTSPVSTIPFPTGTINATDAAFNPTQLGWESYAGTSETDMVRLCSATLSGNVYLFNGNCEPPASDPVNTQRFSIAAATWASLAQTPQSMQFAAATDASNGLLYVVGGFNGAPVTGVPTVRSYHWSFNPVAGTWASLATYPATVMASAYARGTNGRLYSFGGCGSTNSAPNGSVYEYNIGGDSWAGKTAMPTARFGATAVLAASFIYVIGGSNGSLALSTVEAYDPVNDLWVTPPALPEAVMFAKALQFSTGNQRLYALGGAKQWSGIAGTIWGRLDGMTTLVQEYDLTASSWQRTTQMTAPHANFGAAEASGRLFAVSSFFSQAVERTVATINNGFVTGQSIALSMESFTGSLNVTPVYRSLILRGALRPRSVPQIEARVRIGDNVPDRQGTPMRPGLTQLQELRDIAKGASPVQLIDLTGATHWVAVQEPIDETTYQQEGAENPELFATVKMSVMNFSQG